MFAHNITLETIAESLFEEKGLTVSVLRVDKIHPFISGNKWFKLKYNIEAFLKKKKEYLVTFGGAFSNHIIATAAAGKEFGIRTVGIIRGEELNENSNEALKFASACGMKFIFVARNEYRQLRETDELPEWISSHLSSPLSSLFLLPEGGSNALAVNGCEEIVKEIPGDFDFIACATGTGTTLAGISNALKDDQTAIGISVLEGKDFLEKNISKLSSGKKNFRLFHEFSFGGYAKSNDELNFFCKNFLREHGIQIEPNYTGKMFYGLYDLIRKNYFKPGARIVAIHSGGLGIRN